MAREAPRRLTSSCTGRQPLLYCAARAFVHRVAVAAGELQAVRWLMHPLFSLLRELDAANIHFQIGRYRDETVLVTLTVVGERIEVDVFEDGHMEVSRFPGSESIVGDEKTVQAIIQEHRSE